MRTLPRAALAAAALALLVGCASSSPPADTADLDQASQTKPILTDPDLDDELLFVARSKSATLSLDKAGKGTLKMASTSTMTWFSDRPRHDAGTTTSAKALAAFGWKKDGDTLGKDAPNAALTADGLEQAVVLELLSATRNGDEVTFKVATETKPDYDQRKPVLPNAELFIDSVTFEPKVFYRNIGRSGAAVRVRITYDDRGQENLALTFHVPGDFDVVRFDPDSGTDDGPAGEDTQERATLYLTPDSLPAKYLDFPLRSQAQRGVVVTTIRIDYTPSTGNLDGGISIGGQLTPTIKGHDAAGLSIFATYLGPW